MGPRKYRYHSPLISAEWCAFTNFPWGRGLINFEPSEEALAMETYHTWARLFELQPYYLVFVTRRAESFEAARAERLKVSGNPSQYDDLSVFVREQELLRRLVAESMLPVLELDISDDDVSAAADRIADWLETTGGLWIKSGGK